MLSWRDGAPFAGTYGDIYFNPSDGLGETSHVFLAGNDLPGAWQTRGSFTIGELGFGTGLNFLCTWKRWSETKPEGGHLTFISVEGAPLEAEQLRQAHQAFPSLAPFAEQLQARCPPRARGTHIIDFPDGVRLILLYGDVRVMLDQLAATCDAWFLDGFAPRENPAMWSTDVLQNVARCSRPGTTLATYTAAGEVRRSLEAVGFAVERIPGFGSKKHMTRACMPGAREDAPRTVSVAVIGAGIAGLATAAALHRLGAHVALFDANDAPLKGATGTPSGLVMPRIIADTNPAARLAAASFRHAANLYKRAGLLGAQGGLHFADGDDEDRFAVVLGTGLFGADELASVRDVVGTDRQALHARAGGALTGPASEAFDLSGIDCHWNTPVDFLEDLGAFDAVVVTAGDGTSALLEDLGDGLTPSYGQVTRIEGDAPTLPVTYGGYISPIAGGAWIGATHEQAPLTSDEADARNMTQLAKVFPEFAGAARVTGHWRGVRATTPDRLPLAGAVPNRETVLSRFAPLRKGEPVDAAIPRQPGLYVLSGLGSRGLVTAPLLGEHIAALIMDAPSPLERDMIEMLDPARFLLRDLKRNRI